MKKIRWNLAITVLLLAVTTIISFCFFHFGNKYTANITVLYTLALILIALKTSGYIYGIIASIFCVFAVNYFFSYPYFRLNFTLDGYPVTFAGMLTIALITGAVTTSLKQQQQAISEREKQLAEADKEKLRANLLRAVSHDLRTPLTSIIGSADSYLENREELSETECTELVSNIREDSEWLLNMVENLLTVTRINSSSADKVKKSAEVVEEVVSEAILRLQKRIPDAVIHVSMPNNFLMIPMDPTLIEQVLINLMENAVQHGKTTTRIELRLSSAGGLAVFEVADNGCGIEKELLPHLFEGYLTRDQEEISDQRRNMGIGLSVCMSIVQAHGGTMRAENRKKGGALLQFSLPLEENSHEHQR